MDIIKLAGAAGFEDVCKLNMQSLRPLPEVREMCAADKCRAYGRSWSCPPACGSIEHCAKRLASYDDGILVQTVGRLEDEFDLDGIAAAQKLHERRFDALARQLRILCPDCLPLCAGTCTRCLVCTYPDRPCRYPGKRLSSMEAYGLLVSEVCAASGMPYYRGKNTVTFTSCVLFNISKDTYKKEAMTK